MISQNPEVRRCAHRTRGLLGASTVRAFTAKHRLQPNFFRAGAGTISNSLAFTFVHLHGKPYRLPVRLHANMHRLFFRAGAGTISNSLAFTFVRPHGKLYRLYFERELEWSVRAFACKQQLVRLHANTHRSFFSGRSSNGIARGKHLSPSFYLPPSVDLLLTVRIRFFCTRDRVWEGIFAAEHRSAHSSNFRMSSRSSYGRACRLEVFASIFLCCLVLHGLY